MLALLSIIRKPAPFHCPAAPQRKSRRRPGFTLLETMVAGSCFSMVFMGGYFMLNTASVAFDRNTAQSDADVHAVLAMQHIIADLREAKQLQITNPGPSTGSQLVITYPMKNADGSFDRFFIDTNPDNQVTYFVQNRTLWRLCEADSPDPVPVCRGMNDEFGEGEEADAPGTWTNESGIESISFTTDSPRSVRVTVRTNIRRRIPTPDAETGEPVRVSQTTELTERLVYLRNW
jgi:hypothetical protein